MANPYNPYDQEIIGLEKQRETARKLRDSGQQPLKGEMVSGWYVPPSWTQGAANMLRSYLGSKQEQDVEKGIQDLQNRRVAERDAWLGQMPAAKQETLPEGVEGPTRTFQPKTEDYLQWATKGMTLDPASAQMGMTYANLNESREARKQELAAKLRDAAISREEKLQAQKDLFEMNARQDERMARLTASLRPAPVEKQVTVLGPAGEAIPMAQSQAANSGMPLWNPTLAKEAKKQQEKGEAREQLSSSVAQLKGYYDQLKEGGGIPSADQSWMSNIGARLGSSGVGQTLGGAVGTKNQISRQSIEQARPLLLNLIKNATGMSAQQMNSNAEMSMYLKAATDPTLTYEANMNALQNLDKLFGLGLMKDGGSRAASGQVGGAQPGGAKFLGFE
jgi:hypothetical protein